MRIIDMELDALLQFRSQQISSSRQDLMPTNDQLDTESAVRYSGIVFVAQNNRGIR